MSAEAARRATPTYRLAFGMTLSAGVAFYYAWPLAFIAPVLAAKLLEEGRPIVSLPACPMMHGTGGWLGTMMPHTAGGSVVCLASRSFDAHELWQKVQEEKVDIF